MLKNYLISEILKFIYNKGLLLASLALLFFIPAMTLVLEGRTEEIDLLYYQSKFLQSFYLGQAWFIFIAAFYLGGDYGASSLRTNLLLIPNRSLALLAKLMVLLFFTTLFIMGSTSLSLLAISFSAPFPLSMGMVGRLVASLWPVYLTMIQVSMISASLTILGRSSLASLSILLPLLLGLGQLLLGLSPLFAYAPLLATMNAYLLEASGIYLGAGRGILLQGLWMLVGLASAWLVFRRRGVR